MAIDPATLQRILAAGLLAPSADNRHALRFEIDGDTVHLIATDVATWSAFPHRRLLARMAHGAVVENISLASVPLGWETIAATAATPTRPELIATLGWRATEGPGDPLVRSIETRHTNRRFFRRAAPAPALLTAIKTAAEAAPGARLEWLDRPESRAGALRLIRLAETERFKRRELHAELFGAVRFDAGWRRSASEGLPPGALEVEPPMRPVFSLLRHWPLMRAAMLLGGPALLGLRAGDLPCRLAPGLGLITATESPSAPAAFSAGRALQRAWLAATADGLAFQPFAATTVLASQQPGAGWVSDRVKRQLREGLTALARRGDSAAPYMLFRVGYARAPSVVTSRPPLSRHLG